MPLVTLLLVALNLAAYFLELDLGGMRICHEFGLIPAHPSFSTAVSSLFLHDPNSVFHLAGNMVFLAAIGTIVERALGSVAFGGLYLAAGLAGCALHVIVGPSSTDPLVGASGAIFGVLAVAAVLRPRLLGFAVAFVGLNVWQSVMGGDEGVSFGCHIGGFFAGFLVVMFLKVTGSEALEVA